MASWVRIGLVALGAAFVAAAPARAGITAQPADTAALAAMCNGQDLSFCYGYLTAAAQFYEQLVLSPKLDLEPFVCPGREVSQGEARTIFVDWFGANPTAGGEKPLDGLFRAWAAAFPCP